MRVDSLSIHFFFLQGISISEIIREVLKISELMINEQIRDREVRLVGENGDQLGIMSAREAYMKAQEAGLDLV